MFQKLSWSEAKFRRKRGANQSASFFQSKVTVTSSPLQAIGRDQVAAYTSTGFGIRDHWEVGCFPLLDVRHRVMRPLPVSLPLEGSRHAALLRIDSQWPNSIFIEFEGFMPQPYGLRLNRRVHNRWFLARAMCNPGFRGYFLCPVRDCRIHRWPCYA